MIPPSALLVFAVTILVLNRTGHADNIQCDPTSSSSCDYYRGSIDFSTSICSSSDDCNACCSGVEKLTYQAPFAAGEYLAKATRKFSVFDVFGSDACDKVQILASSLGLTATLIGSDGLDMCGSIAAVETATAAQNSANTVADDLIDLESAPSYIAAINAGNTLIASARVLLADAIAAQAASYNLASAQYSAALIVDAQLIIDLTTIYIADDSFPPVPQSLIDAVNATLTDSTLLLESVTAASLKPFGTYYTVSRSWALNRPIYNILDGVVSAANSIYNCYGEYRTIYISKYLRDMAFLNNKKPQSCLTLCNGLQRPNYLPKFKIGA